MNLYLNNQRCLDIKKYAPFFHDGSILGIEHDEKNMTFSLESSEINPSEIDDVKILSKSNTLFGKLHLENVKMVKLDRKPYKNTLHMNYDSGEIFDLEIFPKAIFLLVEWTNFPPKTRVFQTSTIEIDAEKISWENMPWAEGFKFRNTHETE